MLNQIYNVIISEPLRLPVKIWTKLFVLYISKKKNIELKGDLTIRGLPLIDIREGSKLYIGDGVTLNSINKGYHINMHSPVKLYADRKGSQIKIGNKTRIHGSCIHAYSSIRIGSNCLIAANCQIFDGNGHDISFPKVENRLNTTGISKPIIIEDNVWIGANSIILPGVTIGKGSIISANSVVIKDIPPMVIAGGNPAIIIKDYADKKRCNV